MLANLGLRQETSDAFAPKKMGMRLETAYACKRREGVSA